MPRSKTAFVWQGTARCARLRKALVEIEIVDKRRIGSSLFEVSANLITGGNWSRGRLEELFSEGVQYEFGEAGPLCPCRKAGPKIILVPITTSYPKFPFRRSDLWLDGEVVCFAVQKFGKRSFLAVVRAILVYLADLLGFDRPKTTFVGRRVISDSLEPTLEERLDDLFSDDRFWEGRMPLPKVG